MSGKINHGARSGIIGDFIQFARNDNLIISRPTTTTVDIDAAQLTVFDSANRGKVIGTAGVASSINHTLNQDNDSSGGGSNGILGLDTGDFTNDIWYYLYVIYNGATDSCVASKAYHWISTTNDGTAGATNGVLKTNISGYKWGKLVGAVWQSSGVFTDFNQVGNEVDIIKVVVANSTSSIGSHTEIDISGFVPINAVQVRGTITSYTNTSGENNIIKITSKNSDMGAMHTGTGLPTADRWQYGNYVCTLVEPQSIYFRTYSGLTSYQYVYVVGYSFGGII